MDTKLCAKCNRQPALLVHSRSGKPFYSKHCRACMSQITRDSMPRKAEGTRTLTNKGYIFVTVLKDGYTVQIPEHRKIMQEKLGRLLHKGESVHHINGIRDDNRPENLELWVGPIRYGQRAADIKCHHCGTPYLATSLA